MHDYPISNWFLYYIAGRMVPNAVYHDMAGARPLPSPGKRRPSPRERAPVMTNPKRYRQAKKGANAARDTKGLPAGERTRHPAPTVAAEAWQWAMAEPLALHPQAVLQLQRLVGNEAVGHFLRPIRQTQAVVQAKRVLQRQAGEEDEALQAKPLLQRQAEEEEEGLQAKPLLQRQAREEDAEVVQAQSLPSRQGAKTTGIPDGVKTKMETALGADFSEVKIHPHSSQPGEVLALASTQGQDVHFAPGQYAPHTDRGQRLLGHELAHVVQQRAGRVPATGTMGGYAANLDPGLEREADRIGDYAARSSGGPRGGRAGAAVQRRRATTPGAAGNVVQFRLPPLQTVEDLVKTLGIGRVAERLQVAMERMRREKRLKLPKTWKGVDDALTIIFGKARNRFSSTLYHNLTVWNRGRIYKELRHPQEKVSSYHDRFKKKKTRLEKRVDSALFKAIRKAKESAKKVHDIRAVFGKDHVSTVQGTYRTVADALWFFEVRTDRNRDALELGIGGSTSPGSSKIFLALAQLKAKDDRELQVTLIHEACHAVDPTIKDKGYYGTEMFPEMADDAKLTNAAHYEEVPRRLLKISKYPKMRFRPLRDEPEPPRGRTKKPQTPMDKMRKVVKTLQYEVSEELRKAWSTGGDIHNVLRLVAVSQDGKLRERAKTVLFQPSKTMGLTFHLQPRPKRQLTPLDLALSEGNVRDLSLAQKNLDRWAKEDSFVQDVHENYQTKEYRRIRILEWAINDFGSGKLLIPARQFLDFLDFYKDKTWQDLKGKLWP
jgi:hypothetical protein